MKLKPETLEKLRVILKEDFGQEVSDQELHDVAFNLLGYFDTLMQCHYEDTAVVEAPVTQYDNEPKRQEV